MTGSKVLRTMESEQSFGALLMRDLLLASGLLCMIFFAVLPLSWPQQTVLGLLMLLIALWLSKASNSYLITLTMMVMSMFATFRYACWRLGTTATFFTEPGSKWGPLDALFIFVLVGAETYAFIILYLGYIQTIWPLRRAPVPLPDNSDEWPHVDLLIPTYNEPLNLVRYTALAAVNIDWPADKLHVYILDDGKRDEFRKFAEEAGIGYVTRTDNKHAKAGNINRALQNMTAPFVTIFDCDHVPTRSFLQITLGWFLKDKKLGMLQTPHHFYSPDPFERNLGQFRVIPNEGELFYGIVQDGNDFWNATFFCGSCAVLRRTALDEIGGIAVETVTEDAHTALRLQKNGWNTAYINIPQAAGLATESLSGHVSQRIRWARGMVQILRTDCPLFARGLTWAQRLCYFNAMTHFLYALPRLIFLTAPLIYLLLNHTNVPGYWAAILAYALPHLTLSSITNSRIQGQHRHSFWNEIYETVLSPYILLPTMLALINPKLGKFNVTAKGGVVKETFFDKRIAQPFVVLLFLNVAGLFMIIPRIFHVPFLEGWWDGNHPGTIVMNALWVCFNIVILGATAAVAREAQQRRTQVRVEVVAPVQVKLPDGRLLKGKTVDISSGGVSIDLEEPISLPKGTHVKSVFELRVGDADLPATVVETKDKNIRLQFEPLTIVEEELLTMVLYSRADTWLGWGESREVDRPLRSLGRIFRLSLRGLKDTAISLFAIKKKTKPGALAESHVATSILLAVLLTGLGAMKAQAASSLKPHAPALKTHAMMQAATHPETVTAAGTFQRTFTLKDIGLTSAIEMRGIDGYASVFFAMPQNEVVRQANMHMIYHFSPGLIASLSHIKVMLNGTLVATLPAPQATNGSDATLDQTIPLPAELLVRSNQLMFEFIGHYVNQCEDPSNTVLWSRVDPATTISLSGDLLPLADDLKVLPLPFFDLALNTPPVIPIVFPSQPSYGALQAAGIVTSYFGMLADYRSVRFPVSIGSVPAGNAVVIAENSASLPAGISVGPVSGPTVAIRANPNDPYGKVLVVTGGSVDQLIIAAQALAMSSDSSILQGQSTTISDFKLPNLRQADDAPRWIPTDRVIPLWNSNVEAMQSDGSVPLNAYFRIAPDLYYSDKPNVRLVLDYRYNSIPIGAISSLQVKANGAYLGSTPLTPGKESAKTVRTDVAVPTSDLRPFSNTLAFQFAFQVNKKGNCQDTTPINMQGSILRDSYIDLRGFPHWAPMPSLELFANAGFPFTRYADLSQTIVVLPTTPTPQEVETYLTLMGHFSAQTGFPVLRVTVADAESMKQGADASFLVIGTTTDQPGIQKVADSLPVVISAEGVKVQDTEGFFAPLHHAWWKIESGEQAMSGELSSSGVPDAIIEGIESPFSSKRSVILVIGKDSSNFDPLLAGLLKTSQSGDISGTVSMLHGTDFQSYRIGNKVYHVGVLPWWTALNLWFMQVPWLVSIWILVISFILAVWARTWLRRRARLRLQVQEG